MPKNCQRGVVKLDFPKTPKLENWTFSRKGTSVIPFRKALVSHKKVLQREKSEKVRKINAVGCKMKKVGPCNFGSPQLKNFLKKVLIDKIYMFLGHEKKI